MTKQLCSTTIAVEYTMEPIQHNTSLPRRGVPMKRGPFPPRMWGMDLKRPAPSGWAMTAIACTARRAALVGHCPLSGDGRPHGPFQITTDAPSTATNSAAYHSCPDRGYLQDPHKPSARIALDIILSVQNSLSHLARYGLCYFVACCKCTPLNSA